MLLASEILYKEISIPLLHNDNFYCMRPAHTLQFSYINHIIISFSRRVGVRMLYRRLDEFSPITANIPAEGVFQII